MQIIIILNEMIDRSEDQLCVLIVPNSFRYKNKNCLLSTKHIDSRILTIIHSNIIQQRTITITARAANLKKERHQCYFTGWSILIQNVTSKLTDTLRCRTSIRDSDRASNESHKNSATPWFDILFIGQTAVQRLSRCRGTVILVSSDKIDNRCVPFLHLK